jgi:2-polyprenyl-6-methoxyphenol hydroxylase-like FAD-dependent oxidoreductase
MVTPAAYVGLALGLALALKGGYLVHLDRRTRALEERAARARRRDRDPDPEDEG